MATYEEVLLEFDRLRMEDRMNMIDEILARLDEKEVRALGHYLGDEAKANFSRAENFYLWGKTNAGRAA